MATAMASPGRKIALFDVDGTLTQPRKVREESYGSHAKVRHVADFLGGRRWRAQRC